MVLISVVGTLVTDNLVDNFGVPLLVTTIAFAIALAATFAVWFRSEKTLSIHSIFTNRREAFYWLAILFTFALGTAAGDLVAEQFSLGYFSTGILFGLIIASLAIGYFLGLDPIIGFWLAYIFTRPLGGTSPHRDVEGQCQISDVLNTRASANPPNTPRSLTEVNPGRYGPGSCFLTPGRS